MLVEAAHSPRRKPIYYGDIAKKTGIQLGTGQGSGELGQLLGEIAVFEANADRPILTAIVINSPQSQNEARKKYGGDGIHGEGLYRIAEELGKGKRSKLKKDFFGVTEMNRCFDEWGNDAYYEQHRSIEVDQEIRETPGFFTAAEAAAFGTIAGQAYDKDSANHARLKKDVLDGLYEKVEYWANELVALLPDFVAHSGYHWQTGPTFRKYLWSRLYRPEDDKNALFFVVSVNGEYNALIYRLYYMNEGGSQSLGEAEQQLIERELPAAAKRVDVAASELVNYSWERLIEESADFIRNYSSEYDRIQSLLREFDEPNIEQQSSLADLTLSNPPLGIKEFPETKRTFKGRDPDYEAIGRERTKTGTAGEELVRKLEKEKLSGTPYANNKIEKQADGIGYDLKSWTVEGEELQIEVKTTTGGIDTPFYLSANEWAYAELPENRNRYMIYRIYDYSIRHKTGKYFIIRNVAESIVKEPTVYKCRYKGPD